MIISTLESWNTKHGVLIIIIIVTRSFPSTHRSTTWWCCLPTGPTWRTPAGCRSTRTSSRRRSRSFTTSTPPAPRSASTPTHRAQREAWPRHSGLSPSLSSSVFLSVSLYHPLPRGGGWRLWALATADVTGASYDNVIWGGGGMSHKPPQSQTAFQMKKKAPLPLSWMVLSLSLWQFHWSWYKLFSADSSSIVVCRIRSSSSISRSFF